MSTDNVLHEAVALSKQDVFISGMQKKLSDINNQMDTDIDELKKMVEEKQKFYEIQTSRARKELTDYVILNYPIPEWFDSKNSAHEIMLGTSGAVIAIDNSTRKRSNGAGSFFAAIQNMSSDD
jgi:hypothetical protein